MCFQVTVSDGMFTKGAGEKLFPSMGDIRLKMLLPRMNEDVNPQLIRSGESFVTQLPVMFHGRQ